MPRQSLISAASRVGDATQALLYTINQTGDEDAEEREREQADTLLALAKAVASLAAALVLKAKDVTPTCQGDQALGNHLKAAELPTSFGGLPVLTRSLIFDRVNTLK